MRTGTAFLIVLLSLAAMAPAAAAPLTARASGLQAVHDGPGVFYDVVGKLKDQQRVTVNQCTHAQRWCLVSTSTGKLTGWVEGSYLIGSGAKNAVSPFEFSYDPIDPFNVFGRHAMSF